MQKKKIQTILIHTWAEITTSRTPVISASCKSCLWACLWASLQNCLMELWSIFQVICGTILQHDVMAGQHSWAWISEGLPGSCITGIFLLSLAATEWELFLLTHQQWGRRQRKAVRDCHIELLARNSCIILQAGQKSLSPKLLSHRLEFVSCPHRSQVPETAVSTTEGYQELFFVFGGQYCSTAWGVKKSLQNKNKARW